LPGAKQGYWFDRLLFEHDNLRMALAYTLGSGQSELALRIVGALRDFWNYSGHAGEGLGWIERALESAEDALPALRAKALNAAGSLSFLRGDYVRGKLFNQEALVLYRELGDQTNIAWALVFLASNYEGSLSDVTEGMAMVEEALALFMTQDDGPGIIRALNLTGEFARLSGDYDRAGKAYKECISYCRQTNDRLREAYALANYGTVAQHQGDYNEAESRIKKALSLFHDIKNKYPLALTLAFLSGPTAAQGNHARAAQLLGASEALLKAMGLGQQPSDQPVIDRYEAAVRERLGEEAFKSAWEKGQAMSLEQAIAFALEE